MVPSFSSCATTVELFKLLCEFDAVKDARLLFLLRLWLLLLEWLLLLWLELELLEWFVDDTGAVL